MHNSRDFVSAEAYCTLGGDVIPAKVAQAFGERYGLQPWATLFVPVALPGKAQAMGMKRQKTVDEGRRKALARTLLEVYMDGGYVVALTVFTIRANLCYSEAMATQTAHLINSQSMNLEILDILSILPPSWPLHLLQDFLSRSFRRTLHARHEGQLVKAISASQNLDVADRTWLVLREQGAIVEEAVDEDEGDAGEKDIGEKAMGLGLDVAQPVEVSVSLDEKAGLRGYDVDGAVDASGR